MVTIAEMQLGSTLSCFNSVGLLEVQGFWMSLMKKCTSATCDLLRGDATLRR